MKFHITKLAAAQRQLRSAIRMFLVEDDELAVHTVASAAYRLLTDLKLERGQDEVANYYLISTFYVVRDYRRGTLPAYLRDDPEAIEWIREMAGKLSITANSNVDDVTVSVPPDVARSFWTKRNKVANFLKHADRDSRAHIALDEVDNLHLLMLTLSAYTDLVVDDLGAEGIVLWLYCTVTLGFDDDLPQHFQDMAVTLNELDPTGRLHCCSLLVSELNATATQ